MKKVLTTGLLSAAIAFSASAMASDLSYDYVDIGYVNTDAGYGIEGDGVKLNGSISINDNVYLVAGWSSVEADLSMGGKIKADTYELGLGYHYGLAARTDLVLGASWLRGEGKTTGFRFGNVDVSDNGYILRAGLRHLLTNTFEVNAVVEHTDIMETGDTGLNLGALYHMAPNVAVGAFYTVGADEDVWGVGLRIKF
jgi:hypothetical protein